MKRGVLLYVGAHVDVYPLTCGELRKAYSRFVYVDGTPGSKYWEPYDCRGARHSVSETTMMDCMLRMGGMYAGMSEFARQPCGGYAATLADDSSVIYYFNSPDCVGVARDVLDSVTALYIKGYAPDAGVVDLLPNVTRVYSTSPCVGPAYYAVCAKGGYDGSNERPWPPEIDNTEWDSEDDGFLIRQYCGSPRLARWESDAPVRYAYYNDESEESDEPDESDESETGPESTKNRARAMTRGVLLYVGAHVDVYPLTCGELRKAYSRFVYVDGTPQSKYWEPRDCRGARESVSELVMMECMQNQGGEYAGMSDFTQQPCGGYLAALADDSSVIYYFNSPDCVGVPRDVLDSVTALYIQGHAPDVSVVDLIPSVTRVYAAPLCVGCEAYAAVCEKAGLDGPTKSPCHRIIDEVYWDDECDAFVVNNRGCSPRLESDAPVRYECSSEESEEWEAESTDSGDSPALD